MTLSLSRLTACPVKIYSPEISVESLRLNHQKIGYMKKLIALTGIGIQSPSSNLLDNETYRNKMLNYIKERMRQRTPLEMVTQELALAHLAKLEAETAVDYAKSVVAYNDARIKRLESYLKDKS
jgi:hypothetical protein